MFILEVIQEAESMIHLAVFKLRLVLLIQSVLSISVLRIATCLYRYPTVKFIVRRWIPLEIQARLKYLIVKKKFAPIRKISKSSRIKTSLREEFLKSDEAGN